MKEEINRYTANDGLQIHVYKWLPGTPVKAVLFLVHGSVEHALRYKFFAEFLTSHGIAVIAPDLRGHGQTALKNGQMSYIAPKDGWNVIMDDLAILKEKIIKEFPEIPLFIFGHSMGSFVVRDFISRYPDKFSGTVLMGSTIGKPLLAKATLLFMHLMLVFRKNTSESPFLHKLIYSDLNKQVKNARTEVDFISRDENEVNKYIADPLCGRTLTIDYAMQLARGSLKTAKLSSVSNIPNELPILVVSGEADPVAGRNAAGVKEMVSLMKKGGQTHLDFKLYPDARHELINEINKKEVMNDILNWMNKQINK